MAGKPVVWGARQGLPVAGLLGRRVLSSQVDQPQSTAQLTSPRSLFEGDAWLLVPWHKRMSSLVTLTHLDAPAALPIRFPRAGPCHVPSLERHPLQSLSQHNPLRRIWGCGLLLPPKPICLPCFRKSSVLVNQGGPLVGFQG